MCCLETASQQRLTPWCAHSPPADDDHGSAPRIYKNLILPEYLVFLTAILHFCRFIFFAQPTGTHRLCTWGAQASPPQTSLGRQIAQPWTVTLPSPSHGVQSPTPLLLCPALLCILQTAGTETSSPVAECLRCPLWNGVNNWATSQRDLCVKQMKQNISELRTTHLCFCYGVYQSAGQVHKNTGWEHLSSDSHWLRHTEHVC